MEFRWDRLSFGDNWEKKFKSCRSRINFPLIEVNGESILRRLMSMGANLWWKNWSHPDFYLNGPFILKKLFIAYETNETDHFDTVKSMYAYTHT